MGTVVPFVPRPAGRDWSSGERAGLLELASRLAARGAQVDAAYGLSDSGDPWCVITDDRDEVLVHVARIDGRFVVHDAASDAIQDENSLWRAFERLLGRAWREGRPDAKVTPIGQSLLVLAAALVLAHEVGRTLPPLNDAAEPHLAALDRLLSRLPPAAADDHHAPVSAGPAQAHGAISTLPNAGAEVVAVQAHGTGGRLEVAGERGEILVGGPGDDLLIGGRGGDHLMGGDGADTLVGGGARAGEIDVLDGGPGDDQLTLGVRTVVIGGSGDNVFVIPSAAELAATDSGAARADAGVVLDFTTHDRFEFVGGLRPTVVSVTPEADVLSGLHGYAALARAVATPGFRIGFDINGDGRADVYVTVAGPAAAGLTTGWRPEGSPLQPGSEHPVIVTGGGHPPAAGGFVLGS